MLVLMLVQTAKEEEGEKKGKGGAKRKAGSAAKAPKRQKKVSALPWMALLRTDAGFIPSLP